MHSKRNDADFYFDKFRELKERESRGSYRENHDRHHSSRNYDRNPKYDQHHRDDGYISTRHSSNYSKRRKISDYSYDRPRERDSRLSHGGDHHDTDRRRRDREKRFNDHLEKNIPPTQLSDSELRRQNPHLAQNPERIQIIPESQLERVLLTDAPRRKYYQRINEQRTTNHWGQRKLLLSEIEFLTDYGHLSDYVVYAGAAPGAKNHYLARLFPHHKFDFIDPCPFHETLISAARSNPQITLLNQFFTDQTAVEYNGKNVLFISDIRTADSKYMEEEEVEDQIIEDNKWQISWHLKMEPAASMLKFRLPWGSGTTQYLSGYGEHSRIYLPVWGRQSTTETRLVAVGSDLYDYDNTKYEEQLFYYNTITRVQYYEHDVPLERVPGLCHCYDCASEVFILKRWAHKYPERWWKPSKLNTSRPADDLPLHKEETEKKETSPVSNTGSKPDENCAEESLGSSEAIVKKEEVSNKDEATEETKKESEETKQESEETKLESEETKKESEETKKESVETKKESEETKKEKEGPTAEEVIEQIITMSLEMNNYCAASGHRDLTVTIGHNQNWFTSKIFDIEKGVVKPLEASKPAPVVPVVGKKRKDRGYIKMY